MTAGGTTAMLFVRQGLEKQPCCDLTLSRYLKPVENNGQRLSDEAKFKGYRKAPIRLRKTPCRGVRSHLSIRFQTIARSFESVPLAFPVREWLRAAANRLAPRAKAHQW